MSEFETRLIHAASSRSDNPTETLEQTLASLEGGAQARAVTDGREALALAVLHVAEPGSHIVVAPSLFAGHREVFTELLPRFGVEADTVADPDDAESWRAELKPTTAALLSESIADPRGDVLAFDEVAELARQHDAAFIVDNTLATPYLVRPIERGADLVVHTSADLLSGRARTAAGIIIDAGTVEPALREPLPRQLGPALPGVIAEEISAGLHTLAARMTRQTAAAQQVAEFLHAHPGVHHAYYSGLVTSPCAERADSYLPAGAGAVVSFEVSAGRDPVNQAVAARETVAALRLFRRSSGVGGPQALAISPLATTHRDLSEEQRRAAGVRPALVRLWIGLEHPADLIADLDTALQRAAHSAETPAAALA
ncbi:PLP-dependent transferase [Nesterenkonia alba]|uniref:PLP-dependent transferase n=1 Tax=Nesterenkonia alba TaxID=515814 RepID=UPI00146EA8AB|nr:PLP-dependent transferase [Nesterenkonia alba]